MNEMVTVPRAALIAVLREAQWNILWEKCGQAEDPEVVALDAVRAALGLPPADLEEPNLEIEE